MAKLQQSENMTKKISTFFIFPHEEHQRKTKNATFLQSAEIETPTKPM